MSPRAARLLALALLAPLVAGCAAPEETRDEPDAPDDATTGDGDAREASGRVTVVENSSEDNRTAANDGRGA